MGAGGGSQSSSSKTKETKLSLAQADILKSRESQYQQYFFPEMLDELKATEGDGRTSELAQTGVQAVNQSFQGARNAFEQSMAQRGLTGSGVEAMGFRGLHSARSNALADTLLKAKSHNTANRFNLLQMGGSMSPSPTTAAPMGQTSSGSGRQWNAKIL